MDVEPRSDMWSAASHVNRSLGIRARCSGMRLVVKVTPGLLLRPKRVKDARRVGGAHAPPAAAPARSPTELAASSRRFFDKVEYHRRISVGGRPPGEGPAAGNPGLGGRRPKPGAQSTSTSVSPRVTLRSPSQPSPRRIDQIRKASPNSKPAGGADEDDAVCPAPTSACRSPSATGWASLVGPWRRWPIWPLLKKRGRQPLM